jgi:molecular chaperone Hsp33
MSNIPKNRDDSGLEVRVYFARGRNALIARADFGELYADLYLHQMDQKLERDAVADGLIRDALAAITLHLASRPWKESVAWTVNFQEPLANVFVSGSNPLGTVVGNIFTENVRQAEESLFFADVATEGQPQRRSVVQFQGGDFFRAAEHFYEQSEQRPARLFRRDEEDIVLVAAQPDCDLEWLAGLTEETVRDIDQEVELSLLETRHYRFSCGCTHDRMLNMLAPVMKRQGEELFQGEEIIRIHCPRCGARHTITREALEAKLAADGAQSE